MDFQLRQIPTDAERVVLRHLALSAAQDGCKILEVGSWCGDSAVILGKVAREKNGHLFCIDWWRGSSGTELMEIAAEVDVYSVFWNRICSEKLDDVVVPIRGRSDVLSEILKNCCFDLIFIDGDHRFDNVLSDIRCYAPLVRKGGILCGHDCEGRISDYDQTFLNAGKEVDCYETVHCGVVLAVGTSFADYSINQAIWSVRASDESGAWGATNLKFSEIEDMRQPYLPLLAYTENYLIWRYGRLIYASPRSLKNVNIASEQWRNHPRIVSAESLAKLAEQLGESLRLSGTAKHLGIYKGFDLVKHGDRVIALALSLGPLDLAAVDSTKLKTLQKAGICFVGDSVHKVKQRLRRRERGVQRWVLNIFR